MIPDKIPVQGSYWNIKVEKDLRDDLGRDLAGLCDSQTKTIYIKSINKRVDRHTFFHELFHALCEQSGLRQTYIWDINIEEILAEQLANLFQELQEREIIDIRFKRKGGDRKSRGKS